MSSHGHTTFAQVGAYIVHTRPVRTWEYACELSDKVRPQYRNHSYAPIGTQDTAGLSESFPRCKVCESNKACVREAEMLARRFAYWVFLDQQA